METYSPEDTRRLAAFMDACAGTDPDVSALEWLNALLTELGRDGQGAWLQNSEDPEAMYYAYGEVCRLLRDLRAAVGVRAGR